jgi:catechol 2,3-dioxygenase
MIKPKLHHVTIKTSHLDEMIAWYGIVIGAQVQFRDHVAAWTTNDAANHRIAFLAVPGLSDDARKVNHNGMHHCAFEYESFEDLMESFDRLRKAGVEPAFCLDHGLTISLYYKDPEGNFVELQSDNFGDWAKVSRIHAHVLRLRG